MDANLPTYDTHRNSQTPVLAEATPYDLQTLTITRREHVELKTAVAYYKRMHGLATERIIYLRGQHQKEIAAWQSKYKALEAELEQTKAQLRGLKQHAFGKRDERAKTFKPPQAQSLPASSNQGKRSRGQQPGW